nr:hypothetical protein [uncultured Desulfobulbus sp.]
MEGKFGAKAKIQLRLSADNREVKFALKDAWGWTMTTQKGGLFRVQIRHHEDKQDRFIITVFGDDDNFALKSWLGDQAKVRSGVRFLDFRLGWKNDQVEMYRGDYSLNLSFAQAIGQVNRFLKENPNEFVLLSMKVDSGDRKKIGNWLTDENNVGLLGKFYRAESLPTLREARGKIVALNRCESSEDTSCIPNLGGIPIRIGDKTSYQSSKKYNAAQDYYMGKATSLNNDDKKFEYIEGLL